MASVQGASGESKQKDYSQLESLDKKESDRGHQRKTYGEENKDAVKLIKEATPSIQDVEVYKDLGGISNH